LAADFALAVDFLAVDFTFAVVFLAADLALVVDFLAVDFALAVVFLAGDFAFAVDFFAVDFLAVDFFAVDFLAAGIFTSSRSNQRSRGHPLQPPALPLAHPTPHPVSLVAAKGVVQALDSNGTLRTDALGLSRRPTLLGEEDLRVVIPTAGSVLPWDEVVHSLPRELHLCNSLARRGQLASRPTNFASSSEGRS
jgi:hypothetical protein